MSETCPAKRELVEIELNRVLTQYRESPHLLGYIDAVLSQVEEAARAACAIPTFFDLDTAVGDPLTLIGKRLGFPRCHCICVPQPVFGFECVGVTPSVPIVGFCADGSWIDCDEAGSGDLCIYDDEVFRAHLKARRYQMMGLFDVGSLTTALRHVWGAAAWVVDAGVGTVTVSPGRALTSGELQRVAITLRILPVAPGVRVTLWNTNDPIFGFGNGWAGLCPAGASPQGSWLCPTYIDPYACA